MIRVRHWDDHNRAWSDAWLLSTLADPHATDGVKLVLARRHSHPSSHGAGEGLEMFVEKSIHRVKLASRMITLLDLEDGE